MSMPNSIYIVSVAMEGSLARIYEDYEENILHVYSKYREYHGTEFIIIMKIMDDHTRNILIKQCIKYSWSFWTKEGYAMDEGYIKEIEE